MRNGCLRAQVLSGQTSETYKLCPQTVGINPQNPKLISNIENSISEYRYRILVKSSSVLSVSSPHLLFPLLFPAGGLWSWNFGCALNADVPVPRGVPPRPALPDPKVPPEEAPRPGVPNPVVFPKAVVLSPVAPKVLVPKGVPNAAPAAKLVPPSPVAIPNGFPRVVVPPVPVSPMGFVWRPPSPDDWAAEERKCDGTKIVFTIETKKFQ